MYIGIDVGGTKLQFAAFVNEKVVLLKRVATPNRYEEFLSVIKKVIEEAVSRFGENVACVGIGLPGTFDDEKVIWVPNIRCLENQNLVEDIAWMLDTKVRLGNDAQLALLGEAWLGAGKGKKDVVLMSVGTGIGGAIMIGGKLVRGRRGAAGAFGWVNLDYTEPVDKDHGYLERHASGSALAGIGQSLSTPLSTFEMVEAGRNGDKSCLMILARIGHLIGVSLASIGSILDTEMVIISGGLSEAFELFEGPLKESFRDYSAPGVEEVPIVRSQLGSDSGVYGAVRLAMVGEVWI